MSDPRCAVEVWNAGNTAKVADLHTTAAGVEWAPLKAGVQRRKNQQGAGNVTVLRGHPALSALTGARRCIRVLEDVSAAGGPPDWRLRGTFGNDTVVDAVVDEGEEAGQVVDVKGAGLLRRLEGAIVEHWVRGADKPQSRNRVWNWASPGIDETPFSSTIVVQTAWGAWRPVAWPDPYATPIWVGSDSGTSHPVGDVYFRGRFNLASGGPFVVFIAADDSFELWIDGVRVQTVPPDGVSPVWWATWRSAVDLPAGWHTVAIKATNVGGPGRLIASGWHASESVGVGAPVWCTGNPAAGPPVLALKAAGYPATPPPVTAGVVLDDCITEAQARGALTGVTKGFTRTADAAGHAFQPITEFVVPVPSSTVWTVADQLAASWADVDMPPAGMQVRLFDKDASPAAASGATLTAGVNLTSLTRTTER